MRVTYDHRIYAQAKGIAIVKLQRLLDMSQRGRIFMSVYYYIVAIHYKDNDETTFIEKVKTLEGDIKLRSTVVSDIEDEQVVMTAIKKSDGRYHEGEQVHIVIINNVKYIRTDQNATECDNLESLPTF